MKLKLFFLLIALAFTILRVNSQPGCPSISAGPNQTVSCSSPCATLTATVLATGTTTSYTVTSIPYAPPAPYNTGTAVLVAQDDWWSNAITLPFSFCFFGNLYTQAVVGSNEIMSFDVAAYANTYCPWTLTAGTTIPTTTYPENSIMCPYQDIDPTNQGGIYYQLLGTSPCRMLAVKYYQVPYYGGTGSINSSDCASPVILATSMAVLYESTNIIEVYIQNKPDCAGWNGGLAIEGIQNSTGTVATAVPGRNCTVFTATNDAYRFTPNGAPNYVITWWQGATQIGTGATITVCPVATTTYTAQVIYTLCTGSQLTLTSNVTVTVNNSIGLNITPAAPVICGGGSTTLTANSTNPSATFLWSPGGLTTSSITVSPTATTTYSVTATVTGCTTTASVTVTVNPIPTITATASPAAICLGHSSTLTAGGGATYVWNTGATTASITVTPAATTTYTVTGTTVAGCSNTASVTVTVNPIPTITITPSVNPVCLGTSTTLTATGGATYLWSTGSTVNPLVVTPTGTTTYTVTGTTAAGCSATASVTITISPNLTVGITASANPVCTGTPTTLTATGGTTYLWSGGLGTANPLTVTPTITTTYTVTGTNASGCTGTANITITVNSTTPISVSASANPICAGIPTTLTATGGTTYLWGGGLGTANPLTVSPSVTTTYTVIGTNAMGCTGTASITININPNLTINIAASANPICIGASTNLTATGGNTYFWNSGSNLNPITVNPNSTTTYTVTGTDLSGCTGTGSITVTVNPLPIVSISAFANPICAGTSTTLTAAGASTYLWGGGLGTANPLTITPASSTSYTVTGTDANGCTGTSSITVNVNPNPIVSISASANPICVGVQTILTASGALTYLWGGGLGSSNPLITSPASTTTYTVTGTDVNGCTGSASITVTVNNNPSVSITPSVNPICNGSSTDLVASGGTTYIWNGGSTANPYTVSPISTTTYTVTGTTLGCTGTATITVNVNPNPVVTVAASVNPICAGFPTTLTAGGAATYSWDNGLGTANPVTATPSVTTTYTVTGTSLGCTGTANITITVNPNPTASVTSTNENCNLSNGTATAIPGGACVTGFTYSWNCSPVQTTVTATHLPAGTYTVTVYCDGCSGTASTTITNLPGPTLAITSVTNTICSYANGGACATATGNNPPYNYVWSNGQTGSCMTNVLAGSYLVTVTDAVGCTATSAVTITDSPPPTASVTSTNDICYFVNGTATVTPHGGTGGDTYLWSNGQTSSTATGLAAGGYIVTVTDANGCTVSEGINVALTPGPDAGINAQPSILTPFENPVSFLDNSSGNIISWQWNFGDGSMGSGADPNHSYPNLGIYVVTLIVTDNNGCQDTATDTIKVRDAYSFYIPNAFTPNGDGYNDVFTPKGIYVDPDSYDEYIFDRWGNLIFHTTKWYEETHEAETWIGTKNNSGDYTDAVMGTYVYRITLKEVDGIRHEYIGKITLVP